MEVEEVKKPHNLHIIAKIRIDQKMISTLEKLQKNLQKKALKRLQKNEEVRRFKVKRIKFALSKKQREELKSKALENNKKHYRIILCQINTGMRISEVQNLIIKDVNLAAKEIFLRPRGDWHPKTPAGIRKIEINEELAKELRYEIGKRKKGYVFISNKGGCYNRNALINMINKYAKECTTLQKTIGSHSLRRTFASVMISSGLEIGKLSKRMGHRSIKITMQYLYEISDPKSGEQIREILNKM